MHPILRNMLAVIAGALIGGTVNGLLIQFSSFIIAPPEGADLTTEQGLTAAMALMEPKHFLVPFLAHALGTLVGAFAAASIAATHKMTFALVIGLLFFVGGTYMVMILPSPLWFNVVDLVGAYFPMAWIGGRLAGAKKTTRTPF